MLRSGLLLVVGIASVADETGWLWIAFRIAGRVERFPLVSSEPVTTEVEIACDREVDRDCCSVIPDVMPQTLKRKIIAKVGAQTGQKSAPFCKIS